MNTENTVEQIELNDSDLEHIDGALGCGYGYGIGGGFIGGYGFPFVGGCGSFIGGYGYPFVGGGCGSLYGGGFIGGYGFPFVGGGCY